MKIFIFKILKVELIMAFSKQVVRIQEPKDENALFTLVIPNILMHVWHLQRNDGCSVWEKMNSCILRSPTKIVELTYDLPESSAGCSSSSSTAADKETENVDETLFLLERFGVSDECYHEMTQLFPELPRSYVVKNERKDISQSIELKELPSKYKEAYRPVRKFIEAILSDKVSYQP